MEDARYTVLADIVTQYPMLAALILLRDVVRSTVEHFAGPHGSRMHETKAFLLLRLQDTLVEACWAFSAIASFTAPTVEAVAFRIHKGRLVLIGKHVGPDDLEDDAKNFFKMKVLQEVAKDAIEVGKLPELLDALGIKGQVLGVGGGKSSSADISLDDLRRHVPFKPTIH